MMITISIMHCSTDVAECMQLWQLQPLGQPASIPYIVAQHTQSKAVVLLQEEANHHRQTHHTLSDAVGAHKVIKLACIQ